jgi:hypothetical protein
VAGKKVAQRSAEQSAQESDQDGRISDLEQQQGGAQQAAGPQDEAPQAGPADSPISEQLKQLSELHDNGALDDAEFSAAKQKLLGI